MTDQANHGEEVIVEEIIIEEFVKENPDKPAPHAKHYRIKIDKETKVVDTPTITGREILALVNKTPEGYKLYQHFHGRQPVPITPDQTVNLREPGVERFTTMAKDHTEGSV